MSNMNHVPPGAKADFASDPPIGYTETPPRAALDLLGTAARAFCREHPGTKPTRTDASLSAGAQTIAAEVLGFGFEDAGVFEHLCGWGVALTYREGVDWTTAGHAFTAGDLRRSMVLELSGSAALALLRGRNLLAGNPDLLGIACRAQRLTEQVGCGFDAALRDATTAVAKVLTFHRFQIEQAAAMIERDGAITRSTPGVSTLLNAARRVPFAAMPTARGPARKLAHFIDDCRVDLGALAREVSQLAMADRP